ncbi:hypothetical protein K458DRAFT_396864 [Lentithecium fluviatile CBS 122367]|uniref:Uncharacterized protein n=1 Tax=Lentithecium fluviatile CBS 122367 TaxID=1168545 RepID=A0A6G1IF82_9PLEO|nr:hypothetical protein K458DRAFT_396864 [Lentithecium fluviatile CBS 122367]
MSPSEPIPDFGQQSKGIPLERCPIPVVSSFALDPSPRSPGVFLQRLCCGEIPQLPSIFIASYYFLLAFNEIVHHENLSHGEVTTHVPAIKRENHKLDPKVVASSNFDQIFMTQLPGNFQGLALEQIFANSLVYTGNCGYGERQSSF